MTKHAFKIKGTQQKNESNQDNSDDVVSDGGLDEDETIERESDEYLESDASRTIVSGDIVLIKTGDNHPCYLLQLTKNPYVTEDVVSGDYGYVVPPSHRVAEGHYLEIHRSNNDKDNYYLNESKTTIVFAFSFVGNCPRPETATQTRHGKQQEMFFVNHSLHQDLCELVNCFACSMDLCCTNDT